MTAATQLTPGLAQAGLALLQIVERNPLTAPQLLAGLGKVGGMPASDALSLSQSLNWLAVDDAGLLRPALAGVRLAATTSYEAALRRVVLDYADLAAPDWVQNATYGRSRMLSFCPGGIHQILVEAGVASGANDEVVAFWDDLAALARGRHDDKLLEIGRHGERLSLQHELARTGRPAKWSAIDSNQDGFDILSIIDTDTPSPLSIEVKATTVSGGDLFLTRNEWEQAEDSTAHVFHLWRLNARPSPQLTVVSVAQMRAHVPHDQSAGEWRLVRVPFAAFAA